MIRTLTIVISIALADSINPSTIGPALVLAAGQHPRRSVLEFTLGVFVVFFLGGALLVLGPGRALLALVPHPSATVRYIGETVVGIAMLIAGAVLWARRRSLARRGSKGDKESADKSSSTSSQRSRFLLGAGIAAVELPTAFPYFAAIAAIVSARLRLWEQLLLVAVYDVCFVLPLLAIVLVLTVAGERAAQIMARIRAGFQAHWPVIASVAALLAGMYVTVLGITGLTSGVSGPTGRVSRRVRRAITK